MAHITVTGQNTQPEHMQGFHPGDRMPSYSQFDTQKTAAKDFIPPDLLDMRPGMYIPPEESMLTNMNPSLDDIMGWQSDEEQQDTDEDEDNEFDMEFDDPEGLPGLPMSQSPINPTLCDRHFSQPNFSTLESTPYTPRLLEPVAYPVLTRYEYEQQPGYKAPFNFINPSSLQLKNSADDAMFSNTPIIADDDARESPVLMAAAAAAPPLVEPLDLHDIINDKTPEDMDLGMDMDFVLDDSRDKSEPIELFDIPELSSPHSIPELARGQNTPKPEPEVSEPTPAQQSQQPQQPVSPELPTRAASELRTPPFSASEAPLPLPSPESPASKAGSPFEDPVSPSALSPPPEKPRKRAVRRAPKAGVASHHGNAHVCNMSFADGKECHRSFTRPYDLARHQETIHAPVRRMYKCDACGEKSKTFSRLDALSRHVRLKHSA